MVHILQGLCLQMLWLYGETPEISCWTGAGACLQTAEGMCNQNLASQCFHTYDEAVPLFADMHRLTERQEPRMRIFPKTKSSYTASSAAPCSTLHDRTGIISLPYLWSSIAVVYGGRWSCSSWLLPGKSLLPEDPP